MRVPILATIVLTSLLGLTGLASPASAGLLELRDDPITLHNDCSITPCRRNNLHYKRIYKKLPYYAYDIHTSPARYEMRRVRIMVRPPVIHVYGKHHRGRGGLVAHPVGAPYRVVAPAKFKYVTSPVLVRPAKTWVTRRTPHSAYFAEDIVVVGNKHRRRGW